MKINNKIHTSKAHIIIPWQLQHKLYIFRNAEFSKENSKKHF
jgi:hypothetical protein